MRVVLDGVFNHTGRGFWPFHHLLEAGASSPYRRWFHVDDAALEAGRPLHAYPPPGTPPSALGYEAWWGLPALPKLNTDEPAVREYLFGVAEHWLRFGIDGWRLDVPAEIDDEAFWQEFRARCRAIQPDAYLVGEIWHLAPDWLRGDRFDALMNYPLTEAILGYAGGSALDVAVINAHNEYAGSVVPRDGASFGRRLMELLSAYHPETVAAQLNLLGSHDSPRLRTVLGGGADRVRLAVLLQATLPGAPCLFYGDEIGLTGGNDPDCRAAFPWDEARWEPGLRETVRALYLLRHAEPAFRADPVRILGTSGSALAYERGAGPARFVVVTNPGDVPARLWMSFPDAPSGHGGHLAPLPLPGLAGVGESLIVDGVALVDVPATTGCILRIV
jgi:neopullulanase